jgi:hypothetical protein
VQHLDLSWVSRLQDLDLLFCEGHCCSRL